MKATESIKKFTGSKIGKIVLIIIVAVAVLAGILIWLYSLPKFQDVTVELGQPMPQLSEFVTKYGSADHASMVTDPASVDLSKPGNYRLQFRGFLKTETVTLTVTDTTAPTAVFQDVYSYIDRIPNPEEFVTEIKDLDAVTVSFVTEPALPDSFGDVPVEIVVTDASGNSVSAQLNIHYVWMRSEYTLGLGRALRKANLLLNPNSDAALLDQAQLDKITNAPAGTYLVTSEADGMTCECLVTVVDLTAPTLALNELTVYTDETAALEDFVRTANDRSGLESVAFVTEPTFGTVGTQTVSIEAVDIYGNSITKETVLNIIEDTEGPVFSGMEDMSANQFSEPDYTVGVTATDNKDGEVEFTVDSSRVNLEEAGTYYVLYTAVDAAGNETTFRRRMVVTHSPGDTAELVASIANSLPNDIISIRNYVRDCMGYAGKEWGGDDPVWYGFVQKNGNCYVHAMCMKAILDYKGIANQLIWVNHLDENGKPTHYWLLVDMGGYWRHIDPTPGRLHGMYPIMTDDLRYETLKKGDINRDWDRDKWPACE